MLSVDSRSLAKTANVEARENWRIGIQCVVNPLDSKHRVPGDRASSVLRILKDIVAKTTLHPMVCGSDVFVGIPPGYEKWRVEALRPRCMELPDAEQRERLLVITAALEAPEHAEEVVEYEGAPMNYAPCPDIAKAVKMYLDWTDRGESERFWQTIGIVFRGRNVPRAVREVSNRRWKAKRFEVA